eukprot:scaffold14877_cov32-Prasinocladus_malaysianus.AAC.1
MELCLLPLMMKTIKSVQHLPPGPAAAQPGLGALPMLASDSAHRLAAGWPLRSRQSHETTL